LSNFRDAGGGIELRNQIRHCKTVCIKRTLYLINYNRMRTQWTTKGNRDAGSCCSCVRGLHRYLRNFGGVWNPKPPPLGTPVLQISCVAKCISRSVILFHFRVTSEILANEYVPVTVKERVKSAATTGLRSGNCSDFPCNDLEGN